MEMPRARPARQLLRIQDRGAIVYDPARDGQDRGDIVRGGGGISARDRECIYIREKERRPDGERRVKARRAKSRLGALGSLTHIVRQCACISFQLRCGDLERRGRKHAYKVQ